MSNNCVYDCAYCVNRRSHDFPRATFSAEELIKLTMNFYRRNYIEGLFLSSAVVRNPDYTMEQMLQVVKDLRQRHRYNGYIHLKAIPGADQRLIEQAGYYVDRMSLNMELPSKKSLMLLAPEKKREAIISPMVFLKNQIQENQQTAARKSTLQRFVPAGQTTQLMIGATQDTDFSIIKLSEAMYKRMLMKRVYYSAYVPVVKNNALLPTQVDAPLLREHRLYQADWLMRFYKFQANELLTPERPNLDPRLDPKCQWALRNMHLFPIEINRADYYMLLRIPGIGPTSARRIMESRRFAHLRYEDLKKLGVVLKRARYFILCKGKYYGQVQMREEILRHILSKADPKAARLMSPQLTLYDLHPDLFAKV